MHDDAGRPLEIVGSWADISDRKQAEQVMGERLAVMTDLQELVAASPAVIYTTQLFGNLACTFVSDNLKSVMGYAPWEMRDDPTFWTKHLHPEDMQRVLTEIDRLIAAGGGSVEYRFRHKRGDYVWIQDSFAVRHDKKARRRRASVPGRTSPTASGSRPSYSALPSRWSCATNSFARPLVAI